MTGLPEAQESVKTTSVAWGDLNGDGFLDLLIGKTGRGNGLSIGGSANELWFNKGGNTFIAASELVGGGGAAETSSVSWLDVNGDGRLDLFIGNGGEANELWIQGSCASGARLPNGGCVECTVAFLSQGGAHCVECQAHQERDALGECAICAPGEDRLLGTGPCAPCPNGTHWVAGSSCAECKLGQYASGTATVACTACPSFATTSNTGATSIDECTCARSFYKGAGEDGTMICSACPEGSTTSTSGSTSVEQCICQQGRYFSADADSTANEGAVTCRSCPEGGTTSTAGSTSVDQCICERGRYFNTDAEGTTTCRHCPEGSTTSTAGSTSINNCVCELGRFPTTNADGTTTCTLCKDVLEFSTTLEGGSSIDACVCQAGYFLKSNETSRKCMPCNPLLMDCSIPGITIANMPIKLGGWRLSNATSTVYECFNPGACVGNPGVAGSNATQRRRLDAGASASTAGDALCAPGHMGFLCGTCIDDW